MKNPIYLILTCAFAFSNSLFSQTHNCGTSHESQLDNAKRIIENRRFANPVNNNARVTTYVPVTFHLVANDEGEERGFKVSDVLDALCTLNDEFQGYTDPIQFYLHENAFNYIDNTNLLNDPTSTEAYNEIIAAKTDNSLNVFIVNQIGGTGNFIGSYYQPPVGVADYIVIDLSFFFTETSLTHPVGHFFSLIHPFFGWEAGQWTDGVQVDSLCPNSTIPTENQSGSNCMVAGDMICDTPPDYLFALSTAGCNFTGNAIDFEGNQVDPMENNTMNYYSGCADNEFTQDQYNAMKNDLSSPAREYVNPGTIPVNDSINSVPVPISPDNGFVTAYNEVLFEWEGVSGATHYFLEIDRLPGFGFACQGYVVNGTSVLIQDFNPGSTHYWRVRGYNQYVTCPGFSTVAEFETGNFVNAVEPDWINSFNLQPNPVSQDQILHLNFQSSKDFSGEIRIYSVSGKLIYTAKEDFTAGDTNKVLNTEGFPIGVYTISLITEDALVSRRVILK